MKHVKRLHPGQRVRILSGLFQFMYGVVEIAEEDRQVANIILEQPCEHTTSEEDYDNLEIVEP